MPRGTHNPEERYGIARTPLGWEVTLVREGVRHTRRFSSRAWGGEAAALLQAQAYRDALVAFNPPISRRARAERPRRNSGATPGVTCERDAQGQPRLWRAKTYVAAGKVLQKTFSVSRWRAAAQAMAMAEREGQLAQMVGHRRVHAAEAAVRERALALHGAHDRAAPVPQPQPPGPWDLAAPARTPD